MKIAWVSSWPPRHCGIATYSYDLVQALRNKGCNIEIVCHTDGGEAGEIGVHPVLDIKSCNWDDILVETISEIDPDVVHIQHEFALYKRGRDLASGLFKPIFRLRTEKRIPVVITYHSVYTKLKPSNSFYIDVMQRLVNAGIVHEACQYKSLPRNLGRSIDNMHIISHGAHIVNPFSKSKIKRKIGLSPEKKIIGLLGWFTPTKGFERVLDNWDYIAEKVGKSWQLVLAGSVRGRLKVQEEYKRKLLRIIKALKYKNRIKVIPSVASQDLYMDIIRSFDMMVLPYTFASQSGNLAHALGCGVPVVVSGLEGLKEEVEKSGAGIVVAPGDDKGLVKNIIDLASNEPLRNKFSKKGRQYVGKKIEWSIIAQQHIYLYENLLS